MACFAYLRGNSRALVILLGAGLGACSLHPLPGDIPQVSTVDIVKSIRCEALAGIDSLRPEERLRAEPIIKATMIGYDFNFHIIESNDVGNVKDSTLLTVLKPDKFTLDLTASASLQRENTRRFTVIEALADLTKPQNRGLCADRTTRANWAYPTTGTIGMDEVVRTYLRVEMLSELQATSKDPKVKFKDTNVVFADDLTFTTHFEAGATTTLVLDAVVGRLKVTKASISAEVSRDDTHSVIVALTRKQVDVNEKTVGKTALREMAAKNDRQDLLKSGNVRDPRTQARLIQIDENARTSVAMELYRRRNLNDPDNAPAQALGQRLLDVLKVP
jgi:hypothetical protein